MTTRPEGFWWFRKGEYNEDKVEDDCGTGFRSWYADRGYVDFQVLRDTLVADSAPGKAITQDHASTKAGRTRSAPSKSPATAASRPRKLEHLLPRSGPGDVAGSGTTVGDAVQPGRLGRGDRAAREPVPQQRLHLRAGRAGRNPPHRPRQRAVRRPAVARSARAQPATINRIIILGNDVTHERVIREAIVLLPGQTFNRDALIRSYENVSNLNFFQQPMPPPDVEPAENGVDVDIIFRVTEKRTGNINFGASVGQGVGVGGFIGLEEPNLFGKAKRGKLQWQFGRNINDFNLSYTDPAILDTRTSGTHHPVQFAAPLHHRRPGPAAAARLPAPVRLSPVRLPLHPDVSLHRGDADPLFRRRGGHQPGLRLRQLHPLFAGHERRPGHPDRAALRGGRLVDHGGRGAERRHPGRHRRLPEDRRGRALVYPAGAAGRRRPVWGRGQFTLGLTAKSGFIIGDPGPFYTELYSMGGVQFGIPLRGYEEFGITPAGFDPSAGGSQAPSRVVRQGLRRLHGRGRRADQPGAVRQHLHRRGQRLPADAGVQSDPAVPQRRLRGRHHFAAGARSDSMSGTVSTSSI